MSYDITFYNKKNTEAATKDQIKVFLSENQYIVSEKETGFEAHYENEDTGVYCYFDYFEEEDEEEKDEETEGYDKSKLTFSLNFGRPSFFAEETLPFVDTLAKKFNFLVYDGNGLRESSIDTLMQSWAHTNKATINFAKTNPDKMTPMPFLSQQASKEWWLYQKMRKTIAGEIEEDIFIPNIFLMMDEKTSEVRRMSTWTEGIACGFPVCDDIMLVKLNEGLMSKLRNKETELFRISYNEAMALLETYLVPLTDIVENSSHNNLKVLRETNTEVFKKVLSASSPMEATWKRISSDSFSDII